MASFFGNGGGLNVNNQTEPFTEANCMVLSNADNFWNLCIFFGANIFAHAATIHPRTGATNTNSFRRMLLMLVAPITAGTVATHAIVTFVLGIWNGGFRWAHFLGTKNSLEEAIAAGAVGIKVPKELAPVLAGRWKLVGDERYSLMLDHERSHPAKTSREPHIPADDASLEFILPPQSKLPGYKGYKFYPSSSFANELIAVVQLIYGVWQLVTEYSPEIEVMGLSSPMVWALPYLFMSLVNLLANLVMESYSHIVILPPLDPEPTDVNVTKLSQTSSSATLKKVPPSPSKSEISRTSSTTTLNSKRKSVETEDPSVSEKSDAIQLTPVTTRSTFIAPASTASTSAKLIKKDNDDKDLESADQTGGFIRHHIWNMGKRWADEQIDWNEQYLCISKTLARGTKPELDGYGKDKRRRIMRKSITNLSFITWTVRLSWWGKGAGKRYSSSWSRDWGCPPEMEEQLERYLVTHYPGVKASIHEKPLRVYQISRYISVCSTLAVVTALLGALTRFHSMIPVYTGKFLAWIYGPPAILLIPFILLDLNKSSVSFYRSVDFLSQYDAFRGLS
jgi:hypothetical protein